MTLSHPTTAILAAAVELSRGDRLGLARARLAFAELAEADEAEIREAVGLVLMGANARQNREQDQKGRVA